MKINKVENNSNKTSFGWIIPLQNAEKQCGLKSYQFTTEMNGLGKYDVYIKPLKTKTTRERELGCWGPIMYALTLFLSTIAGIGGSNYLLSNFLPQLMGGLMQIGAGLLSSAVIGFSAISALFFKRYNDFSVQAATHKGETKDKDGNPTPAGIVTKEYKIKNGKNRYNTNVNFVWEIQELKQKRFNDFIKNYDTNDLFDAKNYAKILENRPKELNGAEFFNYKIDAKGNTLTTALFDLVPDKELYKVILGYMQRQQNIDYNQKDGNGISCLEKVLISENKEALNLILNAKYTHEFRKPDGWIFYHQGDIDKEPIHNPKVIPYSPELDDIYLNIQDKEFKKMVDDNIKWDFSNWIAVIESYDVSKVEKLKKRFNSPLLDKQQLYKDINHALSNCKDMNFITYMQTNFLPELQNTKKEI